jgi:hypothetical protein
MYCIQCKIEAKETAKFCPRCGGRLVSRTAPEIRTMQCPQCGKIYGTDHQFCANDGSQLQPQRTPTNFSPKPPPTTTSTPVLKIVLLILVFLFLAALGTGGYLYFSGRWMDMPMLAKLFSPPLTETQLKNSEYYFAIYGERVVLKEGEFERGTMPSEGYFGARLEKSALGDLNNDSIVDAAVILESGGGGTGRFIELAAIQNRGGKPKQAASITLGDRIVINSITIANGEIVLDMITHGPNDPACCPNQKQISHYKLNGQSLMQTSIEKKGDYIETVQEVPRLLGSVSDYANMISDKTKIKLENKIREIEELTTIQVVILTIPSLERENIEEFSMRVASSWKIGQTGKDNGIVLVVAKNERKVRIEIGRGLEGKLSDSVLGNIINQVIKPKFQTGDFDGGLIDAISALIAAAK